MKFFLILISITLISCDNIERNKQVERGEKLFKDKSLSASGELACITCHPAGNMDRKNWNVLLGRSWQTQSLWNVMDTGPWLWDGKDMTMKELITFVVDNSMGSPRSLSSSEMDDIIEYMRTIKAPISPFLNTDGTMTDIQKEGKAIFENSSRANCIRCHNGEFFTDQKSWNVNGQLIDTPTLLGIWDTYPFWHDGSMPTLKSVLNNHPWIVGPNNVISPALTDREKNALVAYLNTL